MELKRAILMCARVTYKLTTGFTVHFVDNGSVMWILCKSEGSSNQVINLCVIYPTQPMMYMSDLN